MSRGGCGVQDRQGRVRDLGVHLSTRPGPPLGPQSLSLPPAKHTPGRHSCRGQRGRYLAILSVQDMVTSCSPSRTPSHVCTVPGPRTGTVPSPDSIFVRRCPRNFLARCLLRLTRGREPRETRGLGTWWGRYRVVTGGAPRGGDEEGSSLGSNSSDPGATARVQDEEAALEVSAGQTDLYRHGRSWGTATPLVQAQPASQQKAGQ